MFKTIRRKYQILKSSPITKDIAFVQLLKYLSFKLRCKLRSNKDLQFTWIEGLSFKANKLDAGIVENTYQILQDYEESLFVMHFLRKSSTFLDVGANVGHFTLLAAGVAGAKTISIEPVPNTYQKLVDNIQLNHLDHLVAPMNMGIADKQGRLHFSNDKFTANHIVESDYPNNVQINVSTIDECVQKLDVSLLKIDIEGYEILALKGAGKLLASQFLKAAIVELNQSGEKYGFADEDIFQVFIENQFDPYRYDPFTRSLAKLKSFNKSPTQYNTIFVKDLEYVTTRLRSSKMIKIGKLLV